MLGVEVGQADGPRPALGMGLLERLPGLDVAVLGGDRPVDQVEVHMVEREPVEAVVQGGRGAVAPVVVVAELRGDEDLLAGETRFGDRFADPLLVLVHRRGVDAAVPHIQRDPHRLGGVLGRDLEGAEADLGDPGTGVEGEAGDARL